MRDDDKVETTRLFICKYHLNGNMCVWAKNCPCGMPAEMSTFLFHFEMTQQLFLFSKTIKVRSGREKNIVTSQEGKKNVSKFKKIKK